MRTDWTNPKALFLGFKLGSPSVEHAHMDVGSFVFDADGVRWSMDFGAQNYESLESKNINLWTYGQNAQRWTVFRYNNFAHSTLTFNDDLQYAKGRATLLKTSDHKEFSFATSDLTDVYKDKVAKIIRGVALKDQAYGIIQDEIQTGSNPAKIRWSMVTPSTVEIVSPHEVILKQGNKKLLLKVNSKSPLP